VQIVVEQLKGEVLEVLQVFLRDFKALLSGLFLPLSLSFGQRFAIFIGLLKIFIFGFIFGFFILVALSTHGFSLALLLNFNKCISNP
jgi:hypothetical protein